MDFSTMSPLFPISIITFTTLDRFHHILNSSFTIQFLVSPFFLLNTAAAAAKSLQSCPALCDPIDISSLGSPIPGILQARTTGVGCHFLLQCMKVKSEDEVA